MTGPSFRQRITLAEFLAGHFAAARKGPLKAEAVEEMTPGERLAATFGGQVAAWVSLPKPATYAKVKNPAAFLAWMEKHHPEGVETVRQVRPETQKAFLDAAKANGGRWISPDGEAIPVDGVEVTPGDPAPRVELTPDAAEVIGRAWRAGQIDLSPMLALPAPEEAPDAAA
jgi:hypothetical protein